MKMIRLPLLLSFVLSGLAGAGLVSPDQRYRIEYYEAPAHEGNVKFIQAATGRTLRHEISSGYDQVKYLETEWSPDSRYLAVVSRGTRTTADVELFRFDGGTVERIALPGYRLNLLGRRKLVDGGRHHWVSGLRWEKDSLVFHCKGQWKDGSGDPAVDPENWYHFDVSLLRRDRDVVLRAMDEVPPK